MAMQLHRTGKRPQWVGIRVKDQNAWQKVAARSAGVATIGNFFTLLGFGLVMGGLGFAIVAGRNGDAHPEYYGVAFALVVVGRLCDLLDGWLAEKTGTKSPLGERLDAGFDKLATLITLPALVIAEIIPVWIAVVLALPHVIIAGISAYLLHRGIQPHPSRAGKLSMASAWGAVALIVLSVAIDSYVNQVFYCGAAFGIASVILGLVAAAGYARQIDRP